MLGTEGLLRVLRSSEETAVAPWTSGPGSTAARTGGLQGRLNFPFQTCFRCVCLQAKESSQKGTCCPQ